MATPASPETDQKVTRYKYGEDFQGRLVALLYRDPSVWPRAQEQAKPEYFSNSEHAAIVGVIQSFYKENKRPPDLTELNQALTDSLGKDSGSQKESFLFEALLKVAEDAEQVADWELYKKEMAHFAKRQAHKIAIVKSVDLLRDKEDYEAIHKEFEQAAAVGDGTCGMDISDSANKQRKKIQWFWPGRIPRGKFSLISGDPGVGKSWFTLYLAACVSAGRPMPNSYGRPTEQGHVLVLSAEDDEEDTIIPRFEDCGGDKNFLHVLNGMKDGRMFNLERDLNNLAAYFKMLQNLRLIVIDPISAYIGAGGKVNTWKDSDVRSVLMPFFQVLKEHEVTAIGVLHLNKAQDLGALYRVQGSMAWTAFARSVHLMTQEAREGFDHGLHYFSIMKINNANKEQDSIVWRLKDLGDDQMTPEFPDDAPQPPSIKEQLAFNMPTHGTKSKDALQFLRDLLKNGPVEYGVVLMEARKRGISEGTLRNAKIALGVQSEPGRGDEWGKSFWRLPTEEETKQWAR